MKTVLLTTIGYLILMTLWISCKKHSDDSETHAYSCPATAPLIYQHGNSELALPDAFTPNGDGRNDLFHPVAKNIDTSDYRLSVTSGGDAVLFSTTDIRTGWGATGLWPSPNTTRITYQVSIHFKTQDGTVVDTCNTVTLLGQDNSGCIRRNGVVYHFEDQIDPTHPAAGFTYPTTETDCP